MNRTARLIFSALSAFVIVIVYGVLMVSHELKALSFHLRCGSAVYFDGVRYSLPLSWYVESRVADNAIVLRKAGLKGFASIGIDAENGVRGVCNQSCIDMWRSSLRASLPPNTQADLFEITSGGDDLFCFEQKGYGSLLLCKSASRRFALSALTSTALAGSRDRLDIEEILRFAQRR
jgi:hypothetical protein